MPYLIAEEGPNQGLIFNLTDGEEWVIGRDADTADFVIEDSTVSRKAVQLIKKEDGIYLKNLSRVNPTLVNEVEHEEPILLKNNDRIHIGNTTFLFFQEEPMPAEESEPPPPTRKKRGKKKKDAYDDIFGEIEEESEEPPPPPQEKEEKKEPLPPAPPPLEPNAYDTIFEDVNEPEELPFNLISETPFLLKVIGGPNAGAEIGIEKGRVYTIGKDANTCDIVFQDLSVSRNHARLGISEEGVIDIEDLGSKNGTVVNGSVITERKTVTPQDLIALGTTIFMIIDREVPQETIYSPIVPSYEAPKIEEEAKPAPIEEAPVAVSWKKEPIPLKYLVLAGSAAGIFFIMFLSFFSLFKTKGVEVVRKEPVSEIKEALDKYPEVQFSFNPASGKLFVVGHVLTPVDYAELSYRINQIPFIATIDNNVVIDELVWQMMNDVISKNAAWRSISIHSPSPGKFVVTGYLPNADVAGQLSEYLTVNFPFLERLENKVVVEDILNAQIGALITKENVGGVTFQLLNGEVVLTGMYNEKRSSEYHRLVKEINALNGVRGVKDLAIATHPSTAAIDLTPNYQVSGSSTIDGQGYSVVLNSKIYTVGDQIDGMQITNIGLNTILLERQGIKYKINYTR